MAILAITACNTTLKLCQGWGVGAPMDYAPGRPESVPTEVNCERIDAMIDLLQPDWWYNWMATFYGRQPVRWRPTAWRNVVEAGVAKDFPGYSWIVLNEPEQASQANLPCDLALLRIIHQVDIMHTLGLPHEFVIVTPNVNISTAEGIDYLDYVVRGLRRRAVHIHLGVHFYVRQPDWFRWALQQFWDWYADLDWQAPVVFTECGVPPNEPLEVALEMMPRFRSLLDDPRVLGVAWYGAFATQMPEGAYHGLLQRAGDERWELNELGKRWLELK